MHICTIINRGSTQSVPKGGVDDGENSAQAAIRESYEEAGIPRHLNISRVSKELAALRMDAEEGGRGAVWHVHGVEVDEAEFDEDATWPEAHERKREWVAPLEALRRIHLWYSDPAKHSDASRPFTIEVEGGKISKEEKKARKKDAKGGAMETALKLVLEHQGWSKV